MTAPALDLYTVKQRHGGDVYDGGRRWLGPGPGHTPRDRSLSIWLNETGRALVHSFCGDSFADCAAHLGIKGQDVGQMDRPAFDKMRRQREEEAERRRAAAHTFCAGVWGASGAIADTLAETYLASRGVAPGEDLRFHPAAPYSYHGVGGGPAMVALVRGAGGVPKGLHVTHLRPDGTKMRRTCFGALGGAAVRLQPCTDELAIAEGIETALSFAELHSTPTWAALSTSGLMAFSPPAGVRRLTIAADADDKGAGMDAARELAERASRRCEVVIRPAPAGQDWNDVLRGVGR